jgi:L-2,4-diaminobutyric acid acetyltransferase
MNAYARAVRCPPAMSELVVDNHLKLRQPERRDGAVLHELIAASPPLDLNSRYAYLLLCEHHAQTSVIAECEGIVAGAVTAYVPPTQPDTLFIWQVAVARQVRGQKLGTRMLQHLLQHCIAPRRLRWLEATISPGNHASHRLFTQFARRNGAGYITTTLFSPTDFGDSGHEEECLYRIGPWDHCMAALR